MGFVKKVIWSLILSILIGAAYVLFVDKKFDLTRFLIIVVIALVILFIISFIFFRKKPQVGPQTNKRDIAFQKFDRERAELLKMKNKGMLSPKQFKGLYHKAQDEYERAA